MFIGKERIDFFELIFLVLRFNSGRGYYRRYTKFFGKDGNSVENIVSDALENDEDWEKQIEDWQNTILKVFFCLFFFLFLFLFLFF